MNADAPKLGWFLGGAICVVAMFLLLALVVPTPTKLATPSASIISSPPSVPINLLPAVTSIELPGTHGSGVATSLGLKQTMEVIHSKLREWSQRKTGDREADDRLMNELNALLTDENAGKIIKLLSPEELHGPFGTSALFRWMKSEPVTAANWVVSRPDATEDQAWVVAHGLLADGVDLQEYATELPDSKWKQTYLLDAGIDVLSSNPNELIGLAEQMDLGDTQTNLLQTAVTEWMGNNPATTVNWIGGIADQALREKLISAGAKAYAANDPEAAAAWAVSSMQPGGSLNNTVSSILNVWASANPPAAATWAAQLPAGEMRTSAERAVLGQWIQSDPSAAARWAQNLPGGIQILASLSSN